MTDTPGDKPPFPGFPGFPPAEMLDKMWDMMRLTPFGAAFPGFTPGTAQGLSSPLTAMSDMMTPLMSVEELDKRITDMRAVEQWLTLNLNMLKSATQALEVQRATLSTLRAFGAFAQASMTQPAQGEAKEHAPSWSSASAAAPMPAAAVEANAQAAEASQAAPGAAAFDPSAWWNLLQSQFNQMASFAMAQSGPGDDAAAPGKAGASNKKRAKSASETAASRAAPAKATAGKRATARKPGGKGGSSPAASSSNDE